MKPALGQPIETSEPLLVKSAPSKMVNVNPFQNRTPLTVLEGLKMLLMTPIGILRLMLIVLLIGISLCFMCLATACHTNKSDNTTGDLLPLSPTRRNMLYPVKWCARLIMWCFGYFWVEEHFHNGQSNCCTTEPLSAARVIVCNHVCWIGESRLG